MFALVLPRIQVWWKLHDMQMSSDADKRKVVEMQSSIAVEKEAFEALLSMVCEIANSPSASVFSLFAFGFQIGSRLISKV